MATMAAFAPAEWIYSTLSGDATLTALACGNRIYDDQVPQSAAFPYVQVRNLALRDHQTMNATLFMGSADFLVVAVGRGTASGSIVDTTTLEAVASRCQALLHRANGNASRGIVYFCARERPFLAQYDRNGIVYREVGGIYRVWNQA